MAFSAVIRRVASTSAPLAGRFFGGRNRHFHSLGRILTKETLTPRRDLFLPSSHFSSVAKKPAFDADLLKVIDTEIKCAEECDDHDRVEEIPEGFPFEIQDEKGKNIVILSRTYQGESVEVIVSMPSIVTGEEPDNTREADHDNDGDGDDGDDEKPSQNSIPLTVNVSKGNGPTLEFICTAYPDEVTIDAMSVRENRDSDEEMMAYEGPDFNDLDENLQKAFHKYLELRGISAITTNFLQEYMINKDSREYLLWLKNLKEFVGKK